MTNRQIAQTRFLTVKTIETHLSSVYDKLGIRSRRELPAALGEACAAAVGGSPTPADAALLQSSSPFTVTGALSLRKLNEAANGTSSSPSLDLYQAARSASTVVFAPTVKASVRSSTNQPSEISCSLYGTGDRSVCSRICRSFSRAGSRTPR